MGGDYVQRAAAEVDLGDHGAARLNVRQAQAALDVEPQSFPHEQRIAT
jgi:hypothetical protein